MYRKTKHIHFVGIGGIGMSGIAELLLNLGYTVSGSDLQVTDITAKLEQLGAKIYRGHERQWVGGADVVVTSTAIAEDNPEVAQALEEHIPVIQRAEMLAELMRLKKYGIAIAGSHGKTSTTSLVATILGEAALDPTIVVGGKVASLGGNAKLGEGEFLVAEADESDGSFLKLSPVIEVVTNIDLEHLDYYRDIEHIKDVFLEFINRLPFYGVAIVCFDDKNVAALLPEIHKRTITYGLTEQADLYATRIVSADGGTSFTVKRRQEELGQVTLNWPGRHTIYNSLAAIAVGLELEIDFSIIATALQGFQGVERRIEVKGESGGVLVVDDYGHHPTEIRATLDAVREAWPEKRLVVAFQPHRYSRTQGLFDEFTTAFHRADVLILTDIYPASEAPIEGVTALALQEAIKKHGQRNTFYIPRLIDAPSELLPLLQENDLLLTLGAGNIVRTGEQMLHLITEKNRRD
ncbi:UDP-N-acetylmuramate--L-alanine ligase [Desulfogranum marinum]|uniref:UDP-N-acetylmuramate--L-alanine ligase n=1 Tax=Desulfogranum marinum TaxID=453220 RepID=UPI001963DF8C|nr:UDP-N-acetylmuramate--L-alanine ligase [Desulfogranum marinum]MBM9511070.1 UDP-N-acetylmuramate--L-alanine ligase [Desulfogranum marinum]